MRKVKLPGGEAVPVLGLGTWFIGESSSKFESEVDAVRYAMKRGIKLIDTAEMYANGKAEKVIGAAIKGFDAIKREDLFIISKVLPSNAHFEGVIQACERSLSRLGLSSIDLYLLHWRGSVPLQETLDAFKSLQSIGKIRYFGVSNFNTTDINEWRQCNGGKALVTNQILYNLSRRGAEWDLIPLCNNLNIPIMAYSPLEQGRLQSSPVLCRIGERHNATPLQIALAWVLTKKNVITIPKALDYQHIDQNIASLEIILDADDHALLNANFLPPSAPSHLEML